MLQELFFIVGCLVDYKNCGGKKSLRYFTDIQNIKICVTSV